MAVNKSTEVVGGFRLNFFFSVIVQQDVGST